MPNKKDQSDIFFLKYSNDKILDCFRRYGLTCQTFNLDYEFKWV